MVDLMFIRNLVDSLSLYIGGVVGIYLIWLSFLLHHQRQERKLLRQQRDLLLEIARNTRPRRTREGRHDA